MPISGGLKVFDRSQSLFSDGATAIASSGIGAENRALDKNPLTKWRSSGSADAITETFTITLPKTTTFTRILILDHNFKEFTIKHDVSGVFTDFASVIGLDGSQATISETTFSDDTAYYEFDSVSTASVQITITKTQVADEEKKMAQVIITTELGTLTGFPVVNATRFSRNIKRRRVLSGKSLIQKSEESTRFRLDFRNYPSTGFTADLDLMFTLFDRDANFIMWLSGGRRGTDFFRYTLRGYRLKDAFEMQIDRDISESYTKNVYINMVNLRMSFVEAI